MMRALFLVLALMAPLSAGADVVAAARTLPPGTIIAPEDLKTIASTRPGITDPDEAIGMQTRIMIYEGRPLQATLLQAPRLVARNQTVSLLFQRGAMTIEISGRAMSEGAAGDNIRVMNPSSRNIVNGRVNPDGTVSVMP